jgi:hypothetical protein
MDAHGARWSCKATPTARLVWTASCVRQHRAAAADRAGRQLVPWYPRKEMGGNSDTLAGARSQCVTRLHSQPSQACPAPRAGNAEGRDPSRSEKVYNSDCPGRPGWAFALPLKLKVSCATIGRVSCKDFLVVIS